MLFNEQCAIAVLANLPQRINSEERQAQIEALTIKPPRELRGFVKAIRANVEQLRIGFGIKLDQPLS